MHSISDIKCSVVIFNKSWNATVCFTVSEKMEGAPKFWCSCSGSGGRYWPRLRSSLGYAKCFLGSFYGQPSQSSTKCGRWCGVFQAERRNRHRECLVELLDGIEYLWTSNFPNRTCCQAWRGSCGRRRCCSRFFCSGWASRRKTWEIHWFDDSSVASPLFRRPWTPHCSSAAAESCQCPSSPWQFEVDLKQ